MSNPRRTWLNPSLISSIGDLKDILRDQESFRTGYQRKDFHKVDEAKQTPVYTSDQTFESVDREGPPQSPTSCAQSVPAATKLVVKSDSRLSKQLRCMVALEVKRKYTKQFYQAIKRVLENALPNRFITGTAKIGKEMKEAPHSYIDAVLTTIAEKGTLDEVFD